LLAVNRPVDMIAVCIDIEISVSSGALHDSSFHYKKINTLYDILVASPQCVEQYPDFKTIGDIHRSPAIV
ncbi:LysR family transcriptional regulator, partial [Salmonella enterica subsp. enterica serovar Infantis]